MSNNAILDENQLVERLADGFAALLKQVEELRRHNEEVEKLLGYEPKSPKTPPIEEGDGRELLIQRGIEASKTLRGKNRDLIPGEESVEEQATPSMPVGHPAVERKGSQKMTCPFASMAKGGASEGQQPISLISPRTQRPDSLPTPPETRQDFIEDTPATGTAEQEESHLQPPGSPTSSISKCPIRMLDARPPEEVAEYFETHKHEIPRSHEVCVKRYQRNEQSLRLLDAKYGSLVNMIQGLGVKHQPMLHGRDVERTGDEAVEKWTDDHERDDHNDDRRDAEVAVENASNDAEEPPAADREERESYFDRPLKEIRVGESPSRPWGISVPAGAFEPEDDLPGEQTPGPMPKTARGGGAAAAAAAPLLPDGVHPKGASKKLKKELDLDVDMEEEGDGGARRVIFNGPVLIGYGPDEAAEFLKRSGWGI